jgi:hypothetical protein
MNSLPYPQFDEKGKIGKIGLLRVRYKNISTKIVPMVVDAPTRSHNAFMTEAVTCLPVDFQFAPASPPPVSIRASSRKNRVYVFREFLLTSFCIERGGIVLDVAGGKGDLSWLLCNADQIQAVVVDPRVPKHEHLQKSVAYLKDHPDEALERAIPDRPTHQPLAALVNVLQEPYRQPQHLRILVNHDLVQALRAYRTTKSMSQWVAYWGEALQIARRSRQSPSSARDGQEDVASTLIDSAQKALEILLTTTLVVGFHPDHFPTGSLQKGHESDVMMS